MRMLRWSTFDVGFLQLCLHTVPVFSFPGVETQDDQEYGIVCLQPFDFRVARLPPMQRDLAASV